MPHSRIAVVAALTLLLAGCSAETTSSEAGKPAPAAASPAGGAVVTGTTAPGAIVTLAPAVAREMTAPEHAAVMDQFGLQFLPALLAVRVGQRVEFRNGEDVLHNVRVDNAETKAPVFNVATTPFESYTHVFDAPGYYSVSCDVHPAMRANIFVAATPYVAVADDRGTFTVRDVEPGSYRVQVVGGTAAPEQVVQIAAPKTELTLTSTR